VTWCAAQATAWSHDSSKVDLICHAKRVTPTLNLVGQN
jgi:hypothetical protein